jgi:hypothetical protein
MLGTMANQNPNCWDETNNINNKWEEATESVGDKACLQSFTIQYSHTAIRKRTQPRSLILRPKPLNLFRKALVVKKLENSLLLGRETIVEKNKFTNIRAG